MKTFFALLLVLSFSSVSAEDLDLNKPNDVARGFAYTTGCSLVLGAREMEAREFGLVFDEKQATEDHMWVGDWVQIRAAASKFEEAAEKYARLLKGTVDIYGEMSYEAMIDQVYRTISEYSPNQLEEMIDNCLKGYNMYMDEKSSGKNYI